MNIFNNNLIIIHFINVIQFPVPNDNWFTIDVSTEAPLPMTGVSTIDIIQDPENPWSLRNICGVLTEQC